MPSEQELRDMRSDYSNWYEQYGDEERAVGWNLPKQARRFAAIIDPIVPLLMAHDKLILDFGSGLGHLKSFLDSRGLSSPYLGVDINEDLVGAAKSHRGNYFIVGSDIPAGYEPDILISCGVFNRKFQDSHQLFKTTVAGWIRRVKSVVIVSGLVTTALEQHDANYYASLDEIESLINRDYVDGYTLDCNTLPGEFVLHLFLNDSR